MVYAAYVHDDGLTRHSILVDADHYSDLNRGWVSTTVEQLPYIPKLGRPRRVFGRSPTTGRVGTAVIGSPTAPLWTGQVSIFTVETNNLQIDTMTVVFRRREKFRTAKQPPIPNPVAQLVRGVL
jgi:hypothetical protein